VALVLASTFLLSSSIELKETLVLSIPRHAQSHKTLQAIIPMMVKHT